jgi:hypothetical protein
VCLRAQIVGSVGGNGIAPLELIGHRLRRLTPAVLLQGHRGMRREPIQVLLAAVLLRGSKAVLILLAEIGAEHTEPHIVIQALTSPDCRGVVLVLNRLIAPLRLVLLERCGGEIRRAENPVGRVEKLCRLQNHLYNMLVTMPTRTARWFVR